MPAENVLEVHHLSKHVGQGEHQLTILTGVELLVKPAQTIALIGESGSGKSTLLGILAGLDDGSEGEVRLLGESLTALDEEARAAARQERRLRISVVHAGADAERAGKRAAAGAAARRERQAEPRAGAAAGTAGIGQTARSPAGAAVRRRAAACGAARAFSGRPRVLFADEPTGNLDRQTGDRIADLLFSLNRDFDTTLILVTHDETLAALPAAAGCAKASCGRKHDLALVLARMALAVAADRLAGADALRGLCAGAGQHQRSHGQRGSASKAATLSPAIGCCAVRIRCRKAGCWTRSSRG